MIPMPDGKVGSPIAVLTQPATATDTVFYFNTAVLGDDVPNFFTVGTEVNFECIWYTSKDASSVTLASVADRGFEGTTAQEWPAGTPVARYVSDYDLYAIKENYKEMCMTQVALETAGNIQLVKNTTIWNNAPGVTQMLLPLDINAPTGSPIEIIQVSIADAKFKIVPNTGQYIKMGDYTTLVSAFGYIECTAQNDCIALVKSSVAGEWIVVGYTGVFNVFTASGLVTVNDLTDTLDDTWYYSVVYIDNGVIYAKNRYGAMLDSGVAGTDDTAVIQSALDLGGTILIREGTYTLTADTLNEVIGHSYNCCLVVPNNNKVTRIIGAGTGQTILKLANNQHYADHATVMVLAIGVSGDPGETTYSGLEIADITFDGNKANQTYALVDGSGIILTGGRDDVTTNLRHGLHLHDLVIKNSVVNGIYLGNNSNGYESFALLDHLHITGCGGRAIELDSTDHTTIRSIYTADNGTLIGDNIGIFAYNISATVGSRTTDDHVVLENITTYDVLKLMYLQRPVIRGLYLDTNGITVPDATIVAGLDIYKCVGAVIETDYIASKSRGIWCHSVATYLTEPVAYIHNRGIIKSTVPVLVDNGAFVHLDGGELRGIPDVTAYGFYVTAAGNHCSNVYFGNDLDYMIAGGTGTVNMMGCFSASVLPNSGTIVKMYAPLVHKANHATGGSDAMTPADIDAATSGHTHITQVQHSTGNTLQLVSNTVVWVQVDGLVTLTLPTLGNSVLGDTIQVYNANAAAGAYWKIAQNTDNTIQIYGQSTVAGSTGYILSKAAHDFVSLIYAGYGVWHVTIFGKTLTVNTSGGTVDVTI